MITGTIRPKKIALPSIARVGGENTYERHKSETHEFEMRGICYETDPVKLQEIMDAADKKRDDLHRRLNFGR